MILRWTLKKLFRSPLGVLTSSLAIAAAFLLVALFEAIWEGESEQLVAYIEHTNADVWVMQRGVSNMHMASSFITDTKRDQVADIEGVDRVGAVLYLNTLVEASGRNWFCYVVGIEEEGQLGGPWEVSSGTSAIGTGQAIVPRVLAEISRLGLGDSVRIADRSFEVVGLSEGTFSVGNPITFVHAADLADLLSLTGYDSYLLVRTKPGVSREEVAARIEAEIDKVKALPLGQFIRNDYELASQMGVELIGLMTGISTALAVLLVAFTLYVHTARSRRDLAVLKALGFKNRHVYAGVVLQAVVLTGVATAIALSLAFGVTLAAPYVAPALSLHMTSAIVVKVGLAGLAIAIVASLISARQVANVDPLTAFQR